jgi:hypothetical protein
MTSGVLDLKVAMPAETDCVSARKLSVRSDMTVSQGGYGLAVGVFAGQVLKLKGR